MSVTLIIIYILIGLACFLLLAAFVAFLLFARRKRWLQPKEEPHKTLQRQKYAASSTPNGTLTGSNGQHLNAAHLNRSYISDHLDGTVVDIDLDQQTTTGQLVTDGTGRVYTLTRTTTAADTKSLERNSRRGNHAPYDTVSLTLSNLRLTEADRGGAALNASMPNGMGAGHHRLTSASTTATSTYPDRYRRRRAHPAAVHSPRTYVDGGGNPNRRHFSASAVSINRDQFSHTGSEFGAGEEDGTATAYHDPGMTSLQRPARYAHSTDAIFVDTVPHDTASRSSYAIHR